MILNLRIVINEFWSWINNAVEVAIKLDKIDNNQDSGVPVLFVYIFNGSFYSDHSLEISFDFTRNIIFFMVGKNFHFGFHVNTILTKHNCRLWTSNWALTDFIFLFFSNFLKFSWSLFFIFQFSNWVLKKMKVYTQYW